jgi:hypothetical protein
VTCPGAHERMLCGTNAINIRKNTMQSNVLRHLNTFGSMNT